MDNIINKERYFTIKQRITELLKRSPSLARQAELEDLQSELQAYEKK